MDNLLITGGTGYIGKNLIIKLLNDGYKIYATYHNALPEIAHNNIVWIKYDGTINSLERIEIKIDIIIHLATNFSATHSINNVDSLIQSNILFGVHLLEFARINEINKFINTSTYAQTIDDSNYNPQNFYTSTKQAFEDILKYYTESGILKNITLSLSDTYGPNDKRPKFINLVLEAFDKQEIFNMSPGNQKINYVHIDDVINAFCLSIKILENNRIAKSEKFSVNSDETFTLNELIVHVSNILGKTICTNPGFYPYRQREIMNPIPQFQRVPMWKPKILLADGIRQIIN
jgi:CDP-paratose synthetase